jgi:ABC-type transport system involved in cytochrome c biogenesis permease component
MHDINPTDMTPFLARHDSRTRHLFMATLFASLMVSALTFKRGVLEAEAPGTIRSGIWFPIVVYPLLIVVFWGGHHAVETQTGRAAGRSLPDDCG